MADSMPPQVPPNYTEMAKTVAKVARDLKKDHRFSDLWRNLSGGKIQERCEEYLNGSRILYEECRSLMDPGDEDTVIAKRNM